MTGKILHLTREEYDALEGDNFSTLKLLAKSPAHYQQAKKFKKPPTDAMEMGTACHTATLEPSQFDKRYTTWAGGDRRTKEGKGAWASAQEKAGGRTVLDPDEWAACHDVASAIRRHPEASRLLTGGKAEISLQWTLRTPGVTFLCKARPDYVGHGLADLKKTRDASPAGFQTQAARLHYVAQLAFYCDGYEACTGQRLEGYFIAAEDSEPYPVTVFHVPPEELEKGRSLYIGWLAKLAECRQSQRWGGYADGVVTFRLPTWATPVETEAA